MHVHGGMLQHEGLAGDELRLAELQTRATALRIENLPLRLSWPSGKGGSERCERAAARKSVQAMSSRTARTIPNNSSICASVMIRGGEKATVSPVNRTIAPAFNAPSMAS